MQQIYDELGKEDFIDYIEQICSKVISTLDPSFTPLKPSKFSILSNEPIIQYRFERPEINFYDNFNIEIEDYAESMGVYFKYWGGVINDNPSIKDRRRIGMLVTNISTVIFNNIKNQFSQIKEKRDRLIEELTLKSLPIEFKDFDRFTIKEIFTRQNDLTTFINQFRDACDMCTVEAIPVNSIGLQRANSKLYRSPEECSVVYVDTNRPIPSLGKNVYEEDLTIVCSFNPIQVYLVYRIWVGVLKNGKPTGKVLSVEQNAPMILSKTFLMSLKNAIFRAYTGDSKAESARKQMGLIKMGKELFLNRI
jgi:hypothetical protein